MKYITYLIKEKNVGILYQARLDLILNEHNNNWILILKKKHKINNLKALVKGILGKTNSRKKYYGSW